MTEHIYRTSYPLGNALWPAQYNETEELDVSIHYCFHRARRAYTPPGEYAPIDPPEPAEVDITRIEVFNALPDGKGSWVNADKLTFEMIRDWADTNLFDDLCNKAEDDLQPDPDRALEQARDRTNSGDFLNEPDW